MERVIVCGLISVVYCTVQYIFLVYILTASLLLMLLLISLSSLSMNFSMRTERGAKKYMYCNPSCVCVCAGSSIAP